MTSLQRSLDITLKTVGGSHPKASDCYARIGKVHSPKSEYDQAIECFRESWKIKMLAHGENNIIRANKYKSMGIAFMGKSDYTTALRYLKRGVEVYLKTVGKDHPETASCYTAIGNLLLATEQFDDAVEFFHKSITIQRNTFGEDHPERRCHRARNRAKAEKEGISSSSSSTPMMTLSRTALQRQSIPHTRNST